LQRGSQSLRGLGEMWEAIRRELIRRAIELRASGATIRGVV